MIAQYKVVALSCMMLASTQVLAIEALSDKELAAAELQTGINTEQVITALDAKETSTQEEAQKKGATTQHVQDAMSQTMQQSMPQTMQHSVDYQLYGKAQMTVPDTVTATASNTAIPSTSSQLPAASQVNINLDNISQSQMGSIKDASSLINQGLEQFNIQINPVINPSQQTNTTPAPMFQ